VEWLRGGPLLNQRFNAILANYMNAMLFYLIAFGGLGLSLFAMWRVKAAYAKYSGVPNSTGLTGAQVAATILQRSGIYDVQIVPGNQPLGDHYDPLNKTLVLSPDNYGGNSVAAAGIAAHECGHALQHQAAYAPLTWRMASVRLVGFANMTVYILPLLGLFLHQLYLALTVLCAAWGIIMLFNLVTLPVEFDASARAKRLLPQLGLIRSQGEAEAVNHVLDAAALTYIAAFVTSLGYFLYYLLVVMGGNRRN
jgi:Zn-dependent membrane protease YugP